MTPYTRCRNTPQDFRRMTSLNPDEFDLLLPLFEAAYAELLIEEEANRERPRRNAKGQGGKPTLATAADRLYFMLVYYRTYPLQVAHGQAFGLSESQTNRIIHRLAPVVEKTLGGTAPTRDGASLKKMLLKVLAAGIDPVAALDGTETPTQRPATEPRQTELYSGRSKQHAFKNLIFSVLGMVFFLSPTVEGRCHDKKLAEACALELPEGWICCMDSGFQGFELEGKGKSVVALKKPKGGDHSPSDRVFNRILSSHRVSVEHAIGGCKRARIIKDIYRNRLPYFKDHVMVIAASLSNFRIACRNAEVGQLLANCL